MVFSFIRTTEPPQPADPPRALLVTAGEASSPSERALQARLEKLGYRVSAKRGRVVTIGDAADKRLIVLASAGPAAKTLAGLRVPIVTWQPEAFRVLGMAGPDAGVGFGTAQGQSRVALSNGSHRMAAGLSGRPIVAAPSGFAWALPGPEAIVIASLAGDANRAAILAYEQGALMWNRRAPARRVGFFGGSGLTSDGWNLFDETIRWASTQNHVPQVDAGRDLEAAVDESVRLEGRVEDDGVPEPPWVTRTWSLVSGPGDVNFADPSSPRTSVRFSKPGRYVLHLTASDGLVFSSDDVAVVVHPARVRAGDPTEALPNPQPYTIVGQPALMVTGATVGSGDNKLKQRLLDLGASSVTMKTDANVVAADATGKAVVVITGTVTAGTLGVKLKTVAVPVVDLKNTTFANMSIASSNGTTGSQTKISIVNTNHVLSAGLTGTPTMTTVSTTYGWGVPCPNSANIATLFSDATKYTYFAYESGVTMCSSFVAPARRVALFPAVDAAANNLSTDGGLLFDTAVKWASATNIGPRANAGPDQPAIPITMAASLNGTVIDDGLPNPPGATSCPGGVCWTKVSGPGTVTFANAGAFSTTATFSQTGTYTLQFAVTDGPLTASDTTDVTIPAGGNAAPAVNAGPDTSVTMPGSANLAGNATDDNIPNPPNALTITWSKVSGPGTVTFSSPNTAVAGATFGAKGSYTLRLAAFDGQLTSTDEVVVSVAGNALLIMDNAPAHAGTIQAELESFGYEVTVKDSASAVTADADGRSLIFISSQTSSANLNTQFRDSAIPIIIANPNYYGPMRLTTTTNSDFGSAKNQNKLVIPVGTTHPLAASLNGTVDVSTAVGSFAWGKPSAAAVKIARLPNDQTAWPIFAYTTGATMAGTPTFTAPAPRIGFFMPESLGYYLTTAGRSLLQAAIAWSGGDNTAPNAYAGADFFLTLPNSANLSGQVADDGQPSPPSCPLGVCWTKVSGPGTVTFGSSGSFATTASFSAAGTYTLRFAVTDGALTSTDDVLAYVGAAGGNQPPIANAGFDQTVTLPAGATLTGSAADDGQLSPLACPTEGCWSLKSGPSSVSFGTPGAFTTTATLPSNIPGVYVMRFRVTDGQYTSFDDVSVFVNAKLLLVTAQSTLDGGEAVMAARLEAMNYAVITKTCASSAASDATGMAVVVQSPSCTETDLAPGGTAKFKDVTVPVITMYEALFDNMLLASTKGTQANQSKLVIPAGTTHPLAAGLQGTVVPNTFAATYQWGVPNATTAAKIAALPSDPTKFVIFGYDTGQAMVGGTAPARRVALGFNLYTLQFLSSTGGQLFDAATRWSTGVNTPPHVYAGPNRLVVLPATVALSGTSSDDSLPNPPAQLTCPAPDPCWKQLGGPGTTTFSPSANVTNPTASFSAPGDYVLQFSMTDSVLTSASSLVVTVLPNGTANQPPTASAGPNQRIVFPGGGAKLHATYSDDGLPSPPGQVTVTWSRVSGPGTTTFAPSVNAVDATASFSAAGTYTLRLSVNDGAATATDDLTVYVDVNANPVNGVKLYTNTNDCAQLGAADVPVKARLEQLGFAVVCDSAGGGMTQSQFGIFLGSGNATAHAPGLKNTTKPFLVMDPTAAQLMGLTLSSAGDAGVTQVTINAAYASHQLAAGLQGTVTVSAPGGGLSWGLPGANALTIATPVGQPSHAYIYAYPQNVALPDASATNCPARRVAFFGANDLTVNAGWELFDAAVTWLATGQTPILLVAGSTSLGTSDLAIQTELQKLGYQVTVKAGNQVVAPDSDGKAAVVISGTVATIANFNALAAPIVTWEYPIFPTLKMTGTVSGTNYGTQASQTQVNILDTTSPLAGGLTPTGPKTVLNTGAPAQTFAWGKPSSSGVAPVGIVPDTTKKAVFGYEVGASMVGLNAPDRRVGLFFSNTTPQYLNADGWKLFDASILWAVNSDADGDGLTRFQEVLLGTNPNNADTNGDGIRDGDEVKLGLSPTNLDMDSDGVNNAQELINGTDPFNSDTDGDGCPDNTDQYPLDATRCTIGPDPTPNAAPIITLTEPTNATLVNKVCIPASPCP